MSDSERKERNDLLREILEKLECHRPGERAHAQRVAVYAVAIGERMGLEGDALLALKEAATLHDVGKLAIDGELLRKPNFDHEDHAAAQLHTMMFVRTLPDADWLQRCGAMIRGHHERWDGSGYPDALSGVAIPLGARIIALAEAYDTVLTGAGWRAPTPEEEALAIIQAGAGSQFDPEVVRAFLAVQPLIQPLV